MIPETIAATHYVGVYCRSDSDGIIGGLTEDWIAISNCLIGMLSLESLENFSFFSVSSLQLDPLWNHAASELRQETADSASLVRA